MNGIPSRRALLSGATAAAVLSAASCKDNPQKTGGNVTQDAGNVNDLQDQEQKLTIEPFNRVKRVPDQAYPADLLKTSLEMKNLRERLVRFNNPTKLGWAYLFSSTGELIIVLPVQGKISSTQSSMTTSTGVYKDRGTDGGGNVLVDLPGDDLSYGANEGGPAGKFFFTPDGVYVFWDGPLLYVDAPLNIVNPKSSLSYKSNSKPTN